MKYDVLYSFKSLLEQEQLSDNTKKQYYSFTKKVLRDLDWNTTGEIDPAAVTAELAKLKTANDLSAARNGLKIFCRYFPECRLELPTPKELRKRNRAKRKWEPLELIKVKHKINSLPDESERMAYRLMLNTGMRVSEVAELRPEDIVMDEDGRLRFSLRHTKKGCADVAYAEDPYLLERMPDFIKDKQPGQPLFKACQTLKNRAGDLGLECHDLRRVFAVEEYSKAKQELSGDEAMDMVRQALRHESKRTTQRYLRRKIVK